MISGAFGQPSITGSKASWPRQAIPMAVHARGDSRSSWGACWCADGRIREPLLEELHLGLAVIQPKPIPIRSTADSIATASAFQQISRPSGPAIGNWHFVCAHSGGSRNQR